MAWYLLKNYSLRFLEVPLLRKNDLKEMAAIAKNLIMPFGSDMSSIARKILVCNDFSYIKADEYRVNSLFFVCFAAKRMTV